MISLPSMHHFPHKLEREVGSDPDGDPGVRPRERLDDDAVVLVHQAETDHVVKLGVVGKVLLSHELVAVEQNQVVANTVGLWGIVYTHNSNRRQNWASCNLVVCEVPIEEVNRFIHHCTGYGLKKEGSPTEGKHVVMSMIHSSQNGIGVDCEGFFKVSRGKADGGGSQRIL